MKEILGNNLEQFFFVLLDLLDYQKECGAICTYKSNRYGVWLTKRVPVKYLMKEV